MSATHHLLDGTSNFMIVYLSSEIEKKIIECKSFHCNSCRTVFNENEKINGADSYSSYSSWKPCISTIEICRTSEKFFKIYNGHESKPQYDFKVLYCLIFRSMNLEMLYAKSKFQISLYKVYCRAVYCI